MLFFLSCSHDSGPFNEAGWRKDVEGRKTEALYAPHGEGGRFFNPWMPMSHGGFWNLLKWKLGASRHYTDEEKNFRPDFLPGMKDRILAMGGADFIAWVGHGTFLIRIQGAYWLTDPIFSARAMIPRRVVPPALTAADLADLPGELNVLVSHNHYDHLDAESIRSLPSKARFFVPLGLKETIRELHGGSIKEMDWWDSAQGEKGEELFCLPAQHWSRRIGQSTNTTLWASFLLATPRATIFLSGDSGYFVGFREFGKRFPNIDYALLPISAYHPRWFMHYPHMDVPEAVSAFQDLNAGFFIPTMWGTFHLGDEPAGYPALDLRRTIDRMKLDPSRFIVMDIGQILPLR